MSHITDSRLFEYLTTLELMRDGVNPETAEVAAYADVTGHIAECAACEERLLDLIAEIASTHAAIRSLRPHIAATPDGPHGCSPGATPPPSVPGRMRREGGERLRGPTFDNESEQKLPIDKPRSAAEPGRDEGPTVRDRSGAIHGTTCARAGLRGGYIVSALLLVGVGTLAWRFLPPAKRSEEPAWIVSSAHLNVLPVATAPRDPAGAPAAVQGNGSPIAEVGKTDQLVTSEGSTIVPRDRVSMEGRTRALAEVAPPSLPTPSGASQRTHCGSLFFVTGSERLTPEAKAVVAELARRASLNGSPLVAIEGYSSPEPIRRSRFRDNWELSQARANAVKQELMAHGVAEDRIEAIGMGPRAGGGSLASAMRADVFLTGEQARGRGAASYVAIGNAIP